jgi:hypothetical protein
LPEFTGRITEEAPDQWGDDPIESKMRRLRDLIDAIALLRSDGVHGAGVIGTYHARGWRR